ncbi:MAG: DUF1501 domain-containing protein [Bacteroidota bacterium]
MNRRHFLQNTALATAGTMLIPAFLKSYELQAAPGLSERVLVVVQLSGGNDGLNTVVPFRADPYYQLRPSIAIAKEKLISLTDELGFNPALTGFKSLWDDGLLNIVNSVGYPNPDRSHFRSMDIWHTASDSDKYLYSGWLGRYLDAQCSGTAACTPYDAIEVDDSLGLAMKGVRSKGLALTNPQQYYQATQNAFAESLSRHIPGHDENEQVSYLYRTLAETVSSAGYIYDKSKIYKTTAQYPYTDLGKQLKTVAELIISGLKTNVYYVSISGFDTHIRQNAQQDKLLEDTAKALKVFTDDLKANHKLDDVLVMAFSEFGRRVKQNASNGTDHGTANNLFLIGSKLAKPGFINPAPDLSDLQDGDLKFKTDFRQIYAALLRDWLGANDKEILGHQFDALKLVKA